LIICITIPGKFESLNKYILESKKQRGSWNGGNSMKQKDQRRIIQYIPSGVRLRNPVWIRYTYYEPNRKRDHDNVSGYFHKVFQDALVQAGVIPDDGWDDIVGYSDTFKVDRGRPRIEVELEEVT